MDIKFLEEILTNMKEFLSEQGFVAEEENFAAFKNEKEAIKISYDEKRKQYVLETAQAAEDGTFGDYSVRAGWLFEQDHGAHDTEVIAADFVECISLDIGIVKPREKRVANIALPSKAAAGSTPNIEAFTQKFLALFPQYKDEYKNHVAKYNEYLYVEFLKATAAVKLRELASNPTGNKKQLAKYVDMLNEMYCEGDTVVGNAIIGVVIAGAFGSDLTSFDACKDFFKESPNLKGAARNIIERMKSDKKLQAAIRYQ